MDGDRPGFHRPLFNDPAYRRMVDEVADNRLKFIDYLIEQGDYDAARAEHELAGAELEATPDGWEIFQREALDERLRSGAISEERAIQEAMEISDEAERRRAEWIGQRPTDDD